MSDELVWETPEPARHGRKAALRWKPGLIARPGDWARLPVARPPRGAGPDFEFTTRQLDGQVIVYGRYVGAPQVVA